MSPTLQTIAASLLVLVAFASAQNCDESSFPKVRDCLYKSPIYNNVLFPRNVSFVNKFCMKDMNATINCIRDIRDDCVNNTKVNILMDLTVNMKTLSDGLQDFCSQKGSIEAENQCLSDSFADEKYTTCVNNAIGQEINAGDETDVKKQLDTDCEFFYSFTKCQMDAFTSDSCKPLGTTYGKLTESGMYPYCIKSPVDRELAIQKYNMASAANFLASSLVVFCASVLLLQL